MIKEVIHDPILLAIKSEKATIEDLQMAEDLLGNEYKVHIYFKSIDLGEFIEINGAGCSKA